MEENKNLKSALSIIENTQNHIQLLKEVLTKNSANLDKVVQMLMETKGKVIISGIGKSGHIGKKIAATLSSTGTPAFFINSNEALHGDIGLIHDNDLLMLISNSGNQKEMEPIIHYAINLGIKIIAITQNYDSEIAKHADTAIVYKIEKEGIENIPLAPIVSTEIVLMIGHILTSCLVEGKKFQEEKYKIFHPGGEIGKKLNS